MKINTLLICKDCKEGRFNPKKYSPFVDEPVGTGQVRGELELVPTRPDDMVLASHYALGTPVEDMVLHHENQSGDGAHAQSSVYLLKNDKTQGAYIGELKVTTATEDVGYVTVE